MLVMQWYQIRHAFMHMKLFERSLPSPLWGFHAFWGRWVSDYLCWCQKLVSIQVHVIIKCVFGWHSIFFLLFLFLFHSFPLSFPLFFFFVYFSFSDNVTNVVQVDKDTKFITNARILLSMLAVQAWVKYIEYLYLVVFKDFFQYLYLYLY